ncbi:MAG TPA: protein kinase, partial [Kofleriaceae bacterium]|nr:protein kinase [Kofleriaceae bacterium]
MRASDPVLPTVTTSVGDVDAMIAVAPVAATAIEAGQHVGRYTIRRRLGEGGMGVVYAAHDPELAREVALKVLRPERSSTPAREQRLQREARALARLAHHNVVRVFDVG